MERVILESKYRLIQFTGSSKVAEKLSKLTHGKVKIEDAGFDWKLQGPDVSNIDYVAWQCDQDAYAATGQKCSAQSILYCHQNWIKNGFLDKLKALQSRRKLSDLTIGPVLTWNNQQIQHHVDQLLKLEGAKLLFGEYKDDNELNEVLQHFNQMENHLTAAVVSNDMVFINKIASNTINGVTYTGIRARTTGAPQNHWFGPCGDPRGAGIGTKEAILHVWTTHREVIQDIAIEDGWKTPDCS
ncbi:hypothetical protein IMG5_104840 [Ichthyophthirius multifiliis]|uniref:Aldehyde dehydrogenase domain-containing protein n=1 Tax=Ichthyophthirius multifiliis TaxID=5932 RepID=G0QSZ1_ICHMU|nr:hypothetical protein IMG5_104840 [Ichthyophthirius multifiliis]EGR31662.1 hypothetical protein IMG5_104840 [Ichthyophthirius multifiliis]|eukprot:XP_004035148.1 hypothetical protein IMG5_104840 [Ichthyophthirius multifiliis]